MANNEFQRSIPIDPTDDCSWPFDTTSPISDSKGALTNIAIATGETIIGTVTLVRDLTMVGLHKIAKRSKADQ